MSNSLKNMLVIICSFVAGGGVIYLGEALIHTFHPYFTNSSPVEYNASTLPAGILALIIILHALGAFVSGLLLKKFLISADSFIITLVGLGWTLVGVSSVFNESYPVWYAISDTCVYLPMTILGSKSVGKWK